MQLNLAVFLYLYTASVSRRPFVSSADSLLFSCTLVIEILKRAAVFHIFNPGSDAGDCPVP
jgi:hypothetical protein